VKLARVGAYLETMMPFDATELLAFLWSCSHASWHHLRHAVTSGAS